MARNWHYALVVLAALSVSVYYLARRLYRPPRLWSDQTAHDFGEVAPGQTLTHAFRLRNVGGGHLEIGRVRADCLCSKATVGRIRLERGEETQLVVAFTVPPSTYRAKSKILVPSNDPVSPHRIFTVGARVSPLLELSPRHIDFGRESYGRLSDARLDLCVMTKHSRNLRVTVQDIVAPSPVSARLTTGSDWPRLVVTLAKDAPIGPLTATVVVSHQSNAIRPMELTVRGSVAGPVRAVPPVVFLGLVTSDRLKPIRIGIRGSDPATRTRSRVVAISGNVEPYTVASVISEGDGEQLEIALRASVLETEGRSFEGVIHLRCDGDLDALLNVPVYFYTR